MSVHNYKNLRDKIVLLGETLRICKEPKVKYKGAKIKILNSKNRILNLEVEQNGITTIKKIPLYDEEYKYLIECSRHLGNLF
jgi:hypothetical protein